MNNSTLVLKLLLLIGILLGTPQSFAQKPSLPLMLQELSNPDNFLTYPKDWLSNKKLVIIYVDSACDSCLQTIPQMHLSASEILKNEMRWLFVVNHQNWPIARTQLETILPSTIPLRDFYHDPGRRFQSYFSKTSAVNSKGESRIIIFSFYGERLSITEIQRSDELRGSLMRIKEALALEEERK